LQFIALEAEKLKIFESALWIIKKIKLARGKAEDRDGLARQKSAANINIILGYFALAVVEHHEK
jgi:hypothetical protein